MGDPTGVIITQHARQRARERCGLGGKSILSLANRAYVRGTPIDQCPSGVRDYLMRRYTEDGIDGQAKLYGEILFIFGGEKLITVWNLPPPIRALLRKMKKKKVAA